MIKVAICDDDKDIRMKIHLVVKNYFSEIKRPLWSVDVYDLLNCLILDYTNCPKTAQFYAQNGSLISPEYSGDITLSNYFVKFF